MDHKPRNPVEHPARGDSALRQPRAPLPPTGGEGGGALGSRYYLLELLGVLLTLFAAELLLRATTGWVPEGEEVYSISELLAVGLRDVGYCLLVWILLTRREPFDWRLPRVVVKWAQEFGWGLLLILAIFGCTYILSLIIFPLDLESSPTRWANPLGNPATLAAFCLLTPIVGLSEELLFRVYVQTRLTQIFRGKNVLPVLLGAVLFAAAHGYPLAGTLRVGVIGLVLGVSYQANRKIPRLVIAHTLWNLMVALLTLVPD